MMCTESFRTDRLSVFALHTGPGRLLFVGVRLDREYPFVCSTAVVTAEGHVEFIETVPDERRRGYAKELWLGIEKRLGRQINGDPVSVEGAALVNAMLARRRAVGRCHREQY